MPANSGFDRVRYTAVDELRDVMTAVDARQMQALVKALLDARSIFTAGAGRSGLAMRGFAMRLMHLGLRTNVIGDVLATALASGDLLVVGSGSGSTPTLVTVCEKARSLGGSVALLTTDPDSAIARMASVVVTVPAPTPKRPVGGRSSAQPMASLFEQSLWLLLDAVITLLMGERGETAEQMFARHANLE